MLSSLSSYFSFCGGERRSELPPGQTQPTQARQGAASLGAPAQGRPVFLSRDSDSSQEFGASQYSVSSLFEEDDSPVERLQPQAQATNLWPSPHATKTPQQAERRPDTPPPVAGYRHQAVRIAESQAPVAQATLSAPAAQVMRDDDQRQASSSNRADECCKVCCRCCDALIRCICCG